MKRFLAVLIALITLLFVVPVSAAEESFEDIIYNEIISAVDIKNYPAVSTDSEIYLLRLMETGYGKNGFESGNALYLYLYNPSRKTITASELNGVQMATAWDEEGMPTSFVKYGLTIEGTALNGLYIRAKVNVSAKTAGKLVNGVRRYGITEFELHETGKYNAKAYKEGYIYEFSGYGDSLKCTKTDFLTLTLDVHQTSYLTGSSTKPTVDIWSYSNQLNSVYFSIPNSIESKYGSLFSVKYEYYHIYTNPVIVTDSEDLEHRLNDYVANGTSLSDLYMCAYMGSLATEGTDWTLCMYSSIGKGHDFPIVAGTNYYKLYDGSVYTAYRNCPVVTDGVYYKPTVIFSVDDVVDGKVLFEANDLQSAFEKYSKLYGETSGLYRNKYSWDLICRTEDLIPSYVREERTREELFDISDLNSTLSWWEKLFTFSTEGLTASDVPYIQKVTYLDTKGSDFSDEFMVVETDVDELQDYCAQAALSNESVYLLRYAIADNYGYSELYHENCEACAGDTSCDAALYMVRGNAYLDFDIIQLSFGNDAENITTFGVVASPTDGFFPGEVWGEKGEEYDWMALIRKILSIVMVVVVLFVIIWLIGKFGTIGQARTNREVRKYYKNKNKKSKNRNRRK